MTTLSESPSFTLPAPTPTDSAATTIIHLAPPPATTAAENLSLITWGSSYILAKHLHHILPPSPTTPSTTTPPPLAIELGAGTGLVGLTFAALRRTNLLLTDLPSIIPALTANAALNAPLLTSAGSTATAAPLDWTAPSTLPVPSTPTTPPHTLSASNPAHRASTLLLADTLYDAEHPALLVGTVEAWLAREQGARVVVCYALRMPYIEFIREFWEGMEGLGLVCLEEGREVPEEGWGEVGGTSVEWCVWGWGEGGKEGV